MGVQEIINYQKSKLKLKSKFIKDKCKICHCLISENGLSDIPGVCKYCKNRM